MFSFAAVAYLLSGFGPEKQDISTVTVRNRQQEMIGLDALVSNRKRGLFILVGSGFKCVSCIEILETWKRRAAEWPDDQLSVAIVGDGRYLHEGRFWELTEKYKLSWPTYYDAYGSLGRRFRLTGADQILAVNGNSITFILPFAGTFWGRIGQSSDLVDLLLWEAIGWD